MTAQKWNDDELLYMIHQADEWALQTLILKYQPMIRGMIRMQSGFSGIAGWSFHEDLEQESRLMAASAINSYREDCGCSFKTYLTHCLRKRLQTLYRHTRSAKEAAFYECESLDCVVNEDHAVYRTEMIPSADRFSDPVYCFKLTQSSDQLRQIRRFFTPQEWQLLCLSLEGLSYKEAAALLNCSVKSYDNRLQRVRRKLQRLIRKMAEDA